MNHIINPLKRVTESQNDKNNEMRIDENPDYITIPPRAEIIVPIRVLNPEHGEGIILKQELKKGIFLCESIVKVNSRSEVLTSIINTTESELKIKMPEVKLKNIEQNILKVLSLEAVEANGTVRVNQIDCRSERLEKLHLNLRTNHLNKEECETLIQDCEDFNHVFLLEGDKLTSTDTVTKSVNTSSQVPIAVKTYRYPEIHKEEVNKQINQMLEDKIIEPSTSPWNSPLWVVPKKRDASGKVKWRVVIDYRKLNDITIGDAYPLPNITDILDQLGNSKYFTTLDLASGFHQIKMDPKDAEKTAFSTPQGHYQYLRMPFGMKNAPATFQRLMNSVLAGIQGIRCLVYLDDIVIYADSLQTHSKKLREVFQRLSEHNSKVQPDKCEFLRREVIYLGHVITEDGVKPDPSKIEAVKNFPVPKSPKDIQSFLGLANYYRKFIKDFSKISKPISSLLKKNVPFLLTSSQQESFDRLKLSLTQEPILRYPDFTKEFILTTDASNFALGAVLSQEHDSHDLPVSFGSKTLNSAESNYSTIERELLAIVWAVKHYRSYLFGRKFKIITDHRPLTWLFNLKEPGSRLVRWRLKLEEYDYRIEYKPGKINSNADALSRIRIPNKNGQEVSINTIESNTPKSYSDFLEILENSVLLHDKIEESDESVFSSTNNCAVLIPKDLEMDDIITSEFKKRFDHSEELKSQNVQLHDVIAIENGNHSIFYLINKENYWDKTSYEDIFKVLNTLKELLTRKQISSVNIPRIGTGFDRLSWEKIRSMLRYIFKGTDIHVKICFDRIIEPTPEQISQILIEYHNIPSAGHSGFHRTYKRIKQNYKWRTMKKDIADFIKNCQSCQSNKLIRKKNHKPMNR